MQQRRGVTLVEMLVVISTMSVIMGLGITTIFLMMRAEGSGAKTLVDSMTYARMANSFRQDVHAAHDVQLVADAADKHSLSLRMSQTEQVTYQIDDENVVRIAKTNDKVDHLEQFRLPNVKAGFELHPHQTAGEGALIELVLTRRHSAATDQHEAVLPTREYRIKALIGRDHRFEKKSD